MKESTKKFIEIAKQALQAAYYNEVCGCEFNNPNAESNWNSKEASKIGEVLSELNKKLVYTT